MLAIVAWAAGSCLVAELLGYLLHRLLHSDRVRFLSRSHMMHHLVLYGPLQPQRPEGRYKDATTGKVALGNIGLEWLIPSALILGCALAVFSLFAVALRYRVVFITGALTWGFLMFSYLHDRMHERGFWLERTIIRRWFVKARHLHDIHHCTLDDDGFMPTNFGIGLFLFDRIFGTLQKQGKSFNRPGYAAALRRYSFVMPPSQYHRKQIEPETVRQESAPSE
jgi:sterol desaturase/sphingolipid hydroxylase (fatty acid hydroxylase superfamily)